MSHRPHRFGLVVWSSSLTTATVVLVGIVSAWWTCAWTCRLGPTTGLQISTYGGTIGALYWNRTPNLYHPGWVLQRDRPSWSWRFTISNAIRGTVSGWEVRVPLWLPSMLLLSVTILTFRRYSIYARRKRRGLCASCGYDRSGLSHFNRCPECGASAEY